MYTMYINALNNTSYTHISLYVAWRVHSLGRTYDLFFIQIKIPNEINNCVTFGLENRCNHIHYLLWAPIFIECLNFY